MIDFLHLVFALSIGFAIGLFYFSCLWLTVQQLTRTQHPVLLMVGSGVARLSIALLGFSLTTDGYWERLLAALLGFVLARSLLIARWRIETPLEDLLVGE